MDFFVVALRLSLVKPPEDRGDEGDNPQSGLPQWPFLSFCVSKVGVMVSIKRESGERKPQECRLLG